jgi:transposase InsO family protein
MLMPESGYRQVTDHLKNRERINKKRVYRIMKENGLLCRKSNKTRVKTTNSKHGFKKYRNLIKDLTLDQKNQVLVGDVTAYDVKGRDHYLALLMDLNYPRKTRQRFSSL